MEETNKPVHFSMVRSLIVTLGINVLDVGVEGDGTVKGWTQLDLAECAGWEKKPEHLYNALIKAGFMFVDGDTWLFPYVMERCDARKGEARRRASRAYRAREDAKPKADKPRRVPKKSEPLLEIREPTVQEKREEKAVGQIETLRLIPIDVSPKTKVQVQEVVDFYRGKFPARGKHLKPGSPDWRRIERLINQGYTTDELKQCVVGNWMCPWHQEKRAHAISYVFRNSSKVDSFIEIAQRGVPKRISQTERESVEFLEAQRQIDKIVDGGEL